MITLPVYFKLHVIKQVYKWILLSSEMQHLECAGCVLQRRSFHPEDGGTSSPDLQNHSRKNLKSHTLTLYLWKWSPIYAVQVMLLRDGWQTTAFRHHTHSNLWSVIAKAMQHRTLTGGHCAWGYGNIARTRRLVSHLRFFFIILLMTQLLIRGQCGGNVK